MSYDNTHQLLAELSVFCKSDSLSEGGLREIVQRHGWAPNNPSNQSYDFFLSACHNQTIPHDFLLSACRNERVTEGILRYLLDIFPGAGTHLDEEKHSALQKICHNNNVTLGMVQLLLDAFPESVCTEDVYDAMPLNTFCCFTNNLDDEVAVDILKLLLERCPESARYTTYDGSLPIHLASGAGKKSPEFCRLLIEAYPRSERLTDGNGKLPVHEACKHNSVATAKYLLELYPESINVADDGGLRPIDYAMSVEHRTNMVQFLQDCIRGCHLIRELNLM
jgi:ankyrin repeat protein